MRVFILIILSFAAIANINHKPSVNKGSCYNPVKENYTLVGHYKSKTTKDVSITTFFKLNLKVDCSSLVYLNGKVNLNYIILNDLYDNLKNGPRELSSLYKYGIEVGKYTITDMRKSNLIDYNFYVKLNKGR